MIVVVTNTSGGSPYFSTSDITFYVLLMSEQTTVKTSAGQAAKAGLFGALGVISAPVLIVIILIVLCFVCFVVQGATS